VIKTISIRKEAMENKIFNSFIVLKSSFSMNLLFGRKSKSKYRQAIKLILMMNVIKKIVRESCLYFRKNGTANRRQK
jgi:hypothetical protein